MDFKEISSGAPDLKRQGKRGAHRQVGKGTRRLESPEIENLIRVVRVYKILNCPGFNLHESGKEIPLILMVR